MTRGPTPTPTEILRRRGSPLADKRGAEPRPPAIAETEIESAEGLAPPIPLDDLAREVWSQVVPIVHAMGVLTRADLWQLARYALAFGEWRKYAAIVARHGATVEVEAGAECDPAESTPLDALGLADSIVAKLAPTNSRTVRDLEQRIEAGHLADLRGIGKGTIATIERAVAAWRALNPIERSLGTSTQRAEFWTLNKLEEKLTRYERNFGLSPADRTRLHISEEKLDEAVTRNGKQKRSAKDLITGRRN